jgi:SNF2 family DNA or RNA helicase
MSTAYHAKYFAFELTKRCASDSMEKLAASLADAQVDLNPHQVEAALFAFRSPLSKGAILADEVGLGKTIEAGILLSQRWAERKRKILIIVPASLRKQWHQELSDKFFLPSVILETKTFNEQIKQGMCLRECMVCGEVFNRIDSLAHTEMPCQPSSEQPFSITGRAKVAKAQMIENA